MKLNLTPFHFEEIIKKAYSMDMVILLMMIHENLDISALCEESAKIRAIHSGLILKGLISETEDKITTLGTELLVFMDSKEPKKMTRKKADPSIFELWWLAFPSCDTFTYKGVSFDGDRNMRINKPACRLKFDSIILEGEHTAEVLIAALKYDVIKKKEASIREKTNKLKYIHNSLTYLNQRSYEGCIDLLKEGVKIVQTETSFGGTEI